MKAKNTAQNKTISQATTWSESKDSSLPERSKYTLELVNNNIANADSKVSISSGVFSVVVAVIVFIAENILKDIDKTNGINPTYHRWFVCLVILSAVVFLGSEFFHLWAISPSFFAEKKDKQRKKKPTFSIFYDEIRQFENFELYIEAAKKATESCFETEVLKEVYFNSKICSNKMKRFKVGLWLGGLSVALIIASCILYYCSYMVH